MSEGDAANAFKEVVKLENKYRVVPMRELRSKEAKLNPFPVLKGLRESSPIRYDQERRSWDVFRFRDIHKMFTLPHQFSNERHSPVYFSNVLVTMDPPRHKQYRDLLNKRFTPKVMRALEGSVVDIVRDLMKEFRDKDEFDMIKDFAEPFPLLVIAELLGVPVTERDTLKKYSMTVFGGAADNSDEALIRHQQAFAQAIVHIRDFMREMIELKRRNPQDDVISFLLDAEIDGKKMSEEELLDQCILLLTAGNETTTHLIGNGARLLVENINVQDQVRNDLSLIPKFVEETLRYYPSVPFAPKFVKEDLEYEGHQMKKGESVNLWVISANRDEEAFEDPDAIKLDRKPNHLAFGHGIHYCLGAPLARLEGKVAFTELLGTLPKMELVEGAQMEPLQSALTWGLKSLPIKFV